VADLLVLEDLDSIAVSDVYCRGEHVVQDGEMIEFEKPVISWELERKVRDSFRMEELKPADFMLDCKSQRRCRIISLIPKELLTEEKILTVDFEKKNGIDLERDILKLAVVERHHNTGHKGVGFIAGAGLKRGAIASSVSHDSHNLIIVGTNEDDMAFAGNRLRQLGGGLVVVQDGQVVEEMPLPIAGLMTDFPAAEISELNEEVRAAAHGLGVPIGQEIFMTMAFVSLPVIPHLKMSTRGLVDVNRQELVSLFVDE